MAQFARPVSDIADGSWASTPFWSKIDEDIGGGGDDSTVSSEAVANATNTSSLDLEGTNTGLTDPVSEIGHILRVLWASSSARDITAHFELWQGVPGTGTLIADNSIALTDATEVTTAYTLTTTETNNITDYNDLHFRLWGRGLGGGPDRSLVVDAIELEFPDAFSGITLPLIGPVATVNTPTQVFGNITIPVISSTVLNPPYLGPSGRGPQRLIVGAGGRTRRSPRISVVIAEAADQITVPLIGPVATLYSHQLNGQITLPHIGPTSVVNAPVQVSGNITVPLIASTVTVYSHQLNANITLPVIASTSVLAPQVNYQIVASHIGPTSTVNAPSVVGVITGPHIGPTGTLFSHQLNGQVTVLHIGPVSTLYTHTIQGPIDLTHIGPVATLFGPTLYGPIELSLIGPVGTLFSHQLNGQITVPHIGPTSTVSAPNVVGLITAPLIGPTSSIFAPQVDLILTVPLIGPTATLFAPQLDSNITVSLIGPTASLFVPQVDGQVTLDHIGPTSTLFAPDVQASSIEAPLIGPVGTLYEFTISAPAAEIGRGPSLRMAGAGGRTRRGYYFTVFNIPGEINLPHLGPTSIVHSFVIPILVGRGPLIRMAGAAGRTRRGGLYQIASFDPAVITLPHLGSVATLHTHSLQGATVELDHIGPTATLYQPAVVIATQVETGLFAPGLSYAKSMPFVPGTGFIAGAGFISPFSPQKFVSPIIIHFLAPTSVVYDFTITGQEIILPHIGPTSQVNAPTMGDTVILPFIGPVVTLHSILLTEPIDLSHIGPTALMYSPQVTTVVPPSDEVPESVRRNRARRSANVGWRAPPPYRR